MIVSLLLQLLSGPIVTAVMGVINKHYDVQMNKDVLQAEIEKAVLGTITDVSKSQADVIKAEAQSESWLVRSWRPITALSFAGVMLFYALFVPVSVAYWGFPAPRIGDALLLRTIDLLALCLGGYIGGRTIEKVVDTVMGRWRK